MNYDNIYNPRICPSSLDENGEIAVNDGRHIWDDTTLPATCAECGTVRDIDTI